MVKFCLYYYIDIRNFPKTGHEQRTELWKEALLDKFIQRYWEETTKIAEASAPDSKSFRGRITNSYVDYLKTLVSKPLWPNILDVLKPQGSLPPFADLAPGEYIAVTIKSGQPIIFAEDRRKAEQDEMKSHLSAIANSRAKAFPRYYRLYKMQLMPRMATVKGAYFIRNYGTDGFIPVAFSLFSLASIYGIVDVSFLVKILPLDARPPR